MAPGQYASARAQYLRVGCSARAGAAAPTNASAATSRIILCPRILTEGLKRARRRTADAFDRDRCEHGSIDLWICLPSPPCSWSTSGSGQDAAKSICLVRR